MGYQFWRGFHFLRNTKRAVTIFGSARLPEDHPYCKIAYEVAFGIGKNGIAVITGGGGSIMQASNQGAFESGGPSIGINIELPREQRLNPFLTRSLRSHYFFVRKVLLCRYSEAFVVLPGGFGTLDEFFEIITLIQTGKMKYRPVVLVGTEFWSGLMDWSKRTLIKEGMITEEEYARIKVVDTANDALNAIGF
jgi:uncharacterized protein (TIGR00730 family)